MNGIIFLRLLFFCFFLKKSIGIQEFNNYIQKYSSSLYTNFGDPFFQKQYIKEYNFFMKSNLAYETVETRVESLNFITSLFCKSRILNFVTQSLIYKGVIDKNFEIINKHEDNSEQFVEVKDEKIKKESINEDGGKKIEEDYYFDKKRKKIKIKGKIYEIPESWAKRGIENWNDFQNHILEMISGEYKTVNEDFRSNLSNIIDGLGSIDLDEIKEDLILQYGFLEASFIKYCVEMDFSDEEEKN